MAYGGHSPPKKPEDWVNRARLELRNLTAAYKGDASNDVKIECALLAVEAALKACIWKREKWAAWPKREAHFKFLYGHNYEGMLDRTGLRILMHGAPNVWASWQAIVNVAQKQYRYSPNLPDDGEMNAVSRSARHFDDGVVPWLLKRFEEMI